MNICILYEHSEKYFVEPTTYVAGWPALKCQSMLIREDSKGSWHRHQKICDVLGQKDVTETEKLVLN